jgi:hypothetical protein
MTELKFKENKISPFKNLEIEEFIAIFVKGFKKDTELSKNDILMNIVEHYLVKLHNEYNIDFTKKN